MKSELRTGTNDLLAHVEHGVAVLTMNRPERRNALSGEMLEAIRKRMEAARPRVQHAASRVYDQYLKANHVEDGVKSYSRALQLILGQPFRDAMATYTVRSQ
jgi:hypothetical protein